MSDVAVAEAGSAVRTRPSRRGSCASSRRRPCTSCSSWSACSGSCRRSACSSRRCSRPANFSAEGLVEDLLGAERARRSRTTRRSSRTRRSRRRSGRPRRSRSAERSCRSSSRALAGYAFAWLEFPGRDWLFIVVIALLVVPLQMALIPIFSLYNTLGLFDTVVGPDPLPHGLRAAVRDLPAAQLLHRDPEGHPRVGADRRRLGDPDLPPADPAARPAGDRLARDLPVPLDVERPARRADLRARHAADHRRDLLPAARSSAPTSS